jgi:hypothetical protein
MTERWERRMRVITDKTKKRMRGVRKGRGAR